MNYYNVKYTGYNKENNIQRIIYNKKKIIINGSRVIVSNNTSLNNIIIRKLKN